MTVKAQLSLAFGLVVALFVFTLIGVGLALSSLARDIETLDAHSLLKVLMVDEMTLSRSDGQHFLTDVSATHIKYGFKEA